MMIETWIAIGAVEICVMLLIAAAAVLAAAIRPTSASPVMTYMYACELFPAGGAQTEPELRMEVLDDMRVAVSRTGFGGMLTDRGAVSIAVNVKGTDITIEERITPGNGYYVDEPVGAVAYIDCLRPAGRPLHIHYRSTSLSRETALSLAIAPGITMTRTLGQ